MHFAYSFDGTNYEGMYPSRAEAIDEACTEGEPGQAFWTGEIDDGIRYVESHKITAASRAQSFPLTRRGAWCEKCDIAMVDDGDITYCPRCGVTSIAAENAKLKKL